MKFDLTQRLAVDGGEPAVRTPIPVRKRHGEAEKRHLAEDIPRPERAENYLASIGARPGDPDLSGDHRHHSRAGAMIGPAAYALWP